MTPSARLLQVQLYNWAAALDHTNQDHHDRQNQQDVYESTQRVRADHSQSPQDQQQNGNRPKH